MSVTAKQLIEAMANHVPNGTDLVAVLVDEEDMKPLSIGSTSSMEKTIDALRKAADQLEKRLRERAS